jgi:hypothetical protein
VELGAIYRRVVEVIIGNLQTQNFEWLTVAPDTITALANLKQAWEDHRHDTNAPLTWEDVLDSVWLVPISMNDTIKF